MSASTASFRLPNASSSAWLPNRRSAWPYRFSMYRSFLIWLDAARSWLAIKAQTPAQYRGNLCASSISKAPRSELGTRVSVSRQSTGRSQQAKQPDLYHQSCLLLRSEGAKGGLPRNTRGSTTFSHNVYYVRKYLPGFVRCAPTDSSLILSPSLYPPALLSPVHLCNAPWIQSLQDEIQGDSWNENGKNPR